ncbi:hypothetical protein [Streptomyces griseorubiginosus]|uniref:hypothetical protein n=1 Tax=Streptomyces griseorubiginosus TaxID=67304 RepID=UPI00365ECE43
MYAAVLLAAVSVTSCTVDGHGACAGRAGDAESLLVGERLRPLSRTAGPVTIRVYVPERGGPRARLAEYRVGGGRSFSVRFSDLGRPVTVHRPDGEQIVASGDVMAVLRQGSA